MEKKCATCRRLLLAVAAIFSCTRGDIGQFGPELAVVPVVAHLHSQARGLLVAERLALRHSGHADLCEVDVFHTLVGLGVQAAGPGAHHGVHVGYEIFTCIAGRDREVKMTLRVQVTRFKVTWVWVPYIHTSSPRSQHLPGVPTGPSPRTDGSKAPMKSFLRNFATDGTLDR